MLRYGMRVQNGTRLYELSLQSTALDTGVRDERYWR